jgi:hypothetical protein
LALATNDRRGKDGHDSPPPQWQSNPGRIGGLLARHVRQPRLIPLARR